MQIAATFAGSLAGIGLLLVLTGLYSSVSYATRRRTREMAIRSAIGATRPRIVWADAQAIYQADSRARARLAFQIFQKRWLSTYPAMVRQLERDLPELLAFFRFPPSLW